MIRTRGLGWASVLFLGVAWAAAPAAGQQRPLDHGDVLHWNQIDDPSLSPDGEWIAYVLTAMEGDPELWVRPSGADGPTSTLLRSTALAE